MSNFKLNFEEPPYTMYENELIQEETVFENANQKLAYMFLFSYARAKKIFPSIPKIAQAICASKRTAINVIEWLEEKEFIIVHRNAGKSNNYELNGYFEVAAKIRSNEPVQNLHQCKNDTSANSAPVQDLHPTSANSALVEPKTSANSAPEKTRLEKTKNNNSLSLARLNLKFDVTSTDLILKKVFPEIPFDEIKARLLEDADKGEVVIDTVKRYEGLLKFRINDWIRTKKPYQSKVKPVRKEEIPEYWEKESEQISESEEEKRRKELEELLKDFKK